MRNRRLGSYDWITPAGIEHGAGAGSRIERSSQAEFSRLCRLHVSARRQLKTWLALTSCARAAWANEVSGWKLSSAMRRCSPIEYRPLGRFWRLSRCRLDRSSS